jgi:hypothetical protein
VTLSYEVVTRTRVGKDRAHRYTSDQTLGPGDIVRLEGRDWLIERVEPVDDGRAARLFARPARYRLRLRHPDGREELGAFRRYRPGAPRLGHAFTTIEDRHPISWLVVDERLAHDEEGDPYLDLLSERDYAELEDELPDHELEHALAESDERLSGAAATLARAEAAGLAVELVALEAGEAPDWESAERYLDSLVLDEIEDDLLEACGVDPRGDPQETWLEKVKERLWADLQRFRVDIERDHEEIEEWEFRDGRIFAAVGSFDDEADPARGYGWMCRLVDAGVLGAAGFARVRKAELSVS